MILNPVLIDKTGYRWKVCEEGEVKLDHYQKGGVKIAGTSEGKGVILSTFCDVL